MLCSIIAKSISMVSSIYNRVLPTSFPIIILSLLASIIEECAVLRYRQGILFFIAKLIDKDSAKEVLPIPVRAPIVITEPECKPPANWSIHWKPVNIVD